MYGVHYATSIESGIKYCTVYWPINPSRNTRAADSVEFVSVIVEQTYPSAFATFKGEQSAFKDVNWDVPPLGTIPSVTDGMTLRTRYDGTVDGDYVLELASTQVWDTPVADDTRDGLVTREILKQIEANSAEIAGLKMAGGKYLGKSYAKFADLGKEFSCNSVGVESESGNTAAGTYTNIVTGPAKVITKSFDTNEAVNIGDHTFVQQDETHMNDLTKYVVTGTTRFVTNNLLITNRGSGLVKGQTYSFSTPGFSVKVDDCTAAGEALVVSIVTSASTTTNHRGEYKVDGQSGLMVYASCGEVESNKVFTYQFKVYDNSLWDDIKSYVMQEIRKLGIGVRN
jgi:hypothetical protein